MVLEAGGALAESRQETRRSVAGPLLAPRSDSRPVWGTVLHRPWALAPCQMRPGRRSCPVRSAGFSFRWFPQLRRNFLVRCRPVSPLFRPPEQTRPERVTGSRVGVAARVSLWECYGFGLWFKSVTHFILSWRLGRHAVWLRSLRVSVPFPQHRLMKSPSLPHCVFSPPLPWANCSRVWLYF